MGSTTFLIIGAVGVVAGIAVFAWWQRRGDDRRSGPLTGTVLLAAGVLALVCGWLLLGGESRGSR